MAEGFSAQSVEEESFISPSQRLLTQDQRDRIAKQRELALARRSAKAEALHSPIPFDSSRFFPPPQESSLISPSQRLLTPDQRDRIAKQRELALARRSAKTEALHSPIPFDSSRFFPPPKESSLSSAASNSFRKSARKLFSPPQFTDLDAVSHSVSIDNVFPDIAKSMQNRQGYTTSCVDNTNIHEATASVGADQGGKPDESVVDHDHSEDYDSDIMVASQGSAQKKQWLWLPVNEKPNSEASKNVEVPRRKLCERDGREQNRRRDHAKMEDSIPENNDDGWRSVRKRSLLGHIAGHVNPDSLDKGMSHAQNMRMGNAMNLSSKLLSTRKPQVRFAMSTQQRKVLLAISSGKSVFITGSAGTGKSYLLHEAVNTLRNMYGVNSVFITASTGLAGCAIGGTTLHSFAGIEQGLGEKRELANKITARRKARKRWTDCKALIIDEISMIDGELFDKLEYIARAVRGPAFKDKVFGGIQLVVTGDFFQLPPVHPENPEKYFAFQADCWNDCFNFQVELTHVFRQSDSEFVEMLNEVRRGQCSSTTHLKLGSCDRPVRATNTGILMTKLYPRKMDVGKENEQNLRSLNQDTVAFLAKDDSKSESAIRQLENIRAEKELYLSVGAQVMLVKNVDSSSGLVNGARGVVVRFTSVEELDEGKDIARNLSPSGLWPVVLFACDGVERLVRPESWSVMDGKTEVAKRTQIPLILAWALTVHKCQGMTLDRVEIDLSKSFEYGMVYVALSRVKCLDGLRLIGFDPSLIKVHSKVVQFYEELKTGELL